MEPMKAEEMNWDALTGYELSLYLSAKKRRLEAEEYCSNMVEEMFEDVSPTMTIWDYETGKLSYGGRSVEDLAIDIVSFKEKYGKIIDKLRKKEYMLEIAMSELSPRERDVIKVAHYGSFRDLGLSPEYFNQLKESAEIKLSKHLFAMKEEESRAETEEKILKVCVLRQTIE